MRFLGDILSHTLSLAQHTTTHTPQHSLFRYCLFVREFLFISNTVTVQLLHYTSAKQVHTTPRTLTHALATTY